MSLKNLQDRVEKLEKASGVNRPLIILSVHFVSPDGPEPLTPEETAALEEYKEKMVAEAETKAERRFPVVIYWTREKAQALLTQAEKSDAPDPTTTA